MERQHHKYSLRRPLIIFILGILVSLTFSMQQTNIQRPPFLDPDIIHNTTSQFQFNLILNENRNIPVFFVQYSKDFVRQSVENMLKGVFQKQPGISFALFVDCRDFQHNLNKTLNICAGFDPEKAQQQQQKDLQIQSDKRTDKFFVFDLMTPDPTRIKQKGHELSKNHNIQNLRQHKTSLFNDDYLVKVLRNEIADFVHYVEDTYDMEEFLETKSEFRTAKKAKLLYFDQNLQAPMFLKKLAARLDGRIKVGVTDNFKLAKKYNLKTQGTISLIEYNFVKNNYDLSEILLEENNELESVLKNDNIFPYTRLKKSRDMLLDFEHRDMPVYFMSALSEINQLITHGRIVVLEIEKQVEDIESKCPSVNEIRDKYDVMMNYVCFSRAYKSVLEQAGLNIADQHTVYIIDTDLKTAQPVAYKSAEFNIYDYLPQTPPRQKISTEGEAQLCLKTAMTSKRDPVIYWYNEKQHKNTLKLLEYFNSLPQVTSLIYFCQVYLPDNDLISRFQLKENSLFSMVNQNPKTGQMQKLQFKDALGFVSIKMFLRELSINQMMKVYHDKLTTNILTEIHSAEDLTKQCFNQECIVGLMATKRFRYDTQMEILKQLKLQFSQQGYNFVWINGECHWDVAKQLKLLAKNEKQIDRSYIFYYKEKSNQYSLITGIQQNKYWVKKDVKKWIKGLKEPGQIKRLKFGIDIEEKKCQKQQLNDRTKTKESQQNKKSSQQRRRKNEVKQGQL